MSIEAQVVTHPGTIRKQNEDHWLIDPDLSLYVVSDGLTHPFGAAVAEKTCKEIQRFIRENRQSIDSHSKDPSSKNRQAISELIRTSIEKTSSLIYQETQTKTDMKGVFATACVALLSRGYAFIGHLGDSRVYSIRDGVFHLLTRDHTYLTSMLAEGKPLEDAKRIAYSDNLSAAVGYQPVARASVQIRELSAGERLLLCTDGLSDHFGLTSFRASEWSATPTAKLIEALREHALKKYARDNLTALVIDWDRQKKDHAPAIRDVQSKLGTIREIRLFQHLGERSLMKLLSMADVREIGAKQILIRKGEIHSEMHIVLDGELSLDFGKGPEPTTLKKGETLGEMSLFDGALPSATLTAVQPTTLLSFHRDQLFRAMREDADFAARLQLGILQTVIRRLRERTEPDEDLKRLGNYSVVSILPSEEA